MHNRRGNFSFSMKRQGDLSTPSQQPKSFSLNSVPPPSSLYSGGKGYVKPKKCSSEN